MSVSIEFPISKVSDIGHGVIMVDVQEHELWLRIGYTDGATMPLHWRAACLSKDLARQVADAILTMAERVD